MNQYQKMKARIMELGGSLDERLVLAGVPAKARLKKVPRNVELAGDDWYTYDEDYGDIVFHDVELS